MSLKAKTDPHSVKSSALSTAAEEFGINEQMQSVLESFKALNISSRDGQRSATAKVRLLNRKLPENELEELFNQVFAQGYSSLDLFSYAQKSGIPQPVIASATKSLNAAKAPTSPSQSSHLKTASSAFKPGSAPDMGLLSKEASSIALARRGSRPDVPSGQPSPSVAQMAASFSRPLPVPSNPSAKPAVSPQQKKSSLMDLLEKEPASDEEEDAFYDPNMSTTGARERASSRSVSKASAVYPPTISANVNASSALSAFPEDSPPPPPTVKRSGSISGVGPHGEPDLGGEKSDGDDNESDAESAPAPENAESSDDDAQPSAFDESDLVVMPKSSRPLPFSPPLAQAAAPAAMMPRPIANVAPQIPSVSNVAAGIRVPPLPPKAAVPAAVRANISPPLPQGNPISAPVQMSARLPPKPSQLMAHALGNPPVNNPIVPNTRAPPNLIPNKSSPSSSPAPQMVLSPRGAPPAPSNQSREPAAPPVPYGYQPGTQKRFSNLLIHQFPLVSRQVENGLYSIKRVISYLKKLCENEEYYTLQIMKATTHEGSKLDKLQGDGMRRYISTWLAIQDSVYQMANARQEFKTKVMGSVIVPLQEFHKDADVRRVDLLREMAGLSREMKLVNDNVSRAKKRALEYLANLKASQERDRGVQPHDDQGVFSKLASRVKAYASEPTEVLREKCASACISYQEAIAQANARKRVYREKELPRIFEEMDRLERVRLDVLKEYLTKYSIIYSEMISPLEGLASRLNQAVQNMDTADDVDQFIDGWVAVHGEPLPPVDYRYDLPTNADDVRRNRWDGNLELKTESNSIFGVSLDEVMKLQSAKFPAATVPVILTTLLDTLRQLDGPRTEGIFRISANKTALDQLHREFDKGHYECKIDNPHLAAGLLKEWLRNLSEPLIPAELYASCIEASKEEPINPQKVLVIWQQVPELTKAVVDHLVRITSEIVQNVAATKMTVENMAIVFAPSFMRCESDDPMEMMLNSKLEMKFVSCLLSALMSRKR